jgi:cholesterol transport system auxiliary component
MKQANETQDECKEMTEHSTRKPPMRGTTFPAAIVLLALALPACSMPGKTNVPASQAYLLQADAAASVWEEGASRQCLSLRVAVPTAGPGFITARMAYTTEPPRLDYFAYHEWVAPPARMLAALMETWLDDSGLFGAVVFGSADIRTDLRLDSDLVRLSQDFNGSTSILALEIKVKLVDVSTRALLDARTFSYAETVAGGIPEAGAVAANHAVTQFLTDLAAFVASSIERLDCPPPG